MALLVPGACLHGEHSPERDGVVAHAFPRQEEIRDETNFRAVSESV